MFAKEWWRVSPLGEYLYMLRMFTHPDYLDS
jgi:hypothetical protein